MTGYRQATHTEHKKVLQGIAGASRNLQLHRSAFMPRQAAAYLQPGHRAPAAFQAPAFFSLAPPDRLDPAHRLS
jgi:hypothetical protein